VRPNHSRLDRLWLLVALPGLLLGCRPQTGQRQESTPPFIFRALDLHQQAQNGRSGWRLTSPEARYDIRRHLARAIEPRGEIYFRGKPLYRMAATSGTVINDGQVVLLEGTIEVQRLGPEPLVLRASRVRWLPQQQLMEIDRHPSAQDQHSRVLARRARFLLDRQRLELRGRTQLQWRRQAHNPLLPTPPGPEVLLDVVSADWQLDSGALRAAGPVRGRRSIAGVVAGAAAGTGPFQTLSAAALEGNTLQRRLSLMAPVRLNDPSQRTELQARGLAIDVVTTTMETLAPTCQLLRPGERLEADLCRLNWSTGTFLAEGHVLYNRSANHQSTRGSRLEGRLGDDGIVVFTAPGSKVVSQFRVKQRPTQAPAPARPKPDPIRL